jgi:xanthine dehydrogenase accessory factor
VSAAAAGFAAAAREGGRAALVTVIEAPAGGAGPVPGAKLFVGAGGERAGGLGDPALDDAAAARAEELMWAERSELVSEGGVSLFVDVVAPPPRLVVFGAIDFAAQLCTIARSSGWRTVVVDPRARFATRERFPDAEQVLVAWPEEAFAQLGGIDRATFIAVLTHDPKLDDAALAIALRSPAPYVGAMGSRRANARRRERLLALGLTDEDLARLSAPIGLDLGGLTAEETALSIMAEVVAVRNGRDGGRLVHATRRIHEIAS